MADPLLKWRSEFPILERKKGYLISNSLGAMPRRTYDNLKAYADAWATDGVLAWHDWLPMVVQTGDLIAKLIGAPPGSVMMHQNVANATQMVLSCFDWKAPRNRIVATDLNFPSVPYNYFAQQGAETVLVQGEGTTVPLERILAAIDERTALVSLDLASRPSTNSTCMSCPTSTAGWWRGSRGQGRARWASTGARPVRSPWMTYSRRDKLLLATTRQELPDWVLAGA